MQVAVDKKVIEYVARGAVNSRISCAGVSASRGSRSHDKSSAFTGWPERAAELRAASSDRAAADAE